MVSSHQVSTGPAGYRINRDYSMRGEAGLPSELPQLGAPGPIWRDGVAIYAEVNVQFSLSQVQDQTNAFGLWRVCFPPCLVRPGRRVPVQGLSEGSLGCLDRLPA